MKYQLPLFLLILYILIIFNIYKKHTLFMKQIKSRNTQLQIEKIKKTIQTIKTKIEILKTEYKKKLIQDIFI